MRLCLYLSHTLPNYPFNTQRGAALSRRMARALGLEALPLLGTQTFAKRPETSQQGLAEQTVKAWRAPHSLCPCHSQKELFLHGGAWKASPGPAESLLSHHPAGPGPSNPNPPHQPQPEKADAGSGSEGRAGRQGCSRGSRSAGIGQAEDHGHMPSCQHLEGQRRHWGSRGCRVLQKRQTRQEGSLRLIPAPPHWISGVKSQLAPVHTGRHTHRSGQEAGRWRSLSSRAPQACAQGVQRAFRGTGGPSGSPGASPILRLCVLGSRPGGSPERRA